MLPLTLLSVSSPVLITVHGRCQPFLGHCCAEARKEISCRIPCIMKRVWSAPRASRELAGFSDSLSGESGASKDRAFCSSCSLGSSNRNAIRTIESIGRIVCTTVAVMVLSSEAVCMQALAVGSSSTPYSLSQTQKMQLGLLNGRIRPCPSDINPNCISTSSKGSAYALPWKIPPEASENATRKILSAILSTQKNPRIVLLEDTPNGQFIQAAVDGRFGRDVLEFLVRKDIVTYRSMAEKVLYVYPFTTPLGDFEAQERRMKTLEDELGWSILTQESMY